MLPIGYRLLSFGASRTMMRGQGRAAQRGGQGQRGLSENVGPAGGSAGAFHGVFDYFVMRYLKGYWSCTQFESFGSYEHAVAIARLLRKGGPGQPGPARMSGLSASVSGRCRLRHRGLGSDGGASRAVWARGGGTPLCGQNIRAISIVSNLPAIPRWMASLCSTGFDGGDPVTGLYSGGRATA